MSVYEKESRAMIGNILHCDFCGSNSVLIKDMNAINQCENDQIGYHPELELNEHWW